MFGYGLSKGVDIDENNYVDFAVGAPNGEAVYIYKTYPVIQTYASIETIASKIPISAKAFNFSACVGYTSKHNIDFDVQLRVTVKIIDNFTRADLFIDGFLEKKHDFSVYLKPDDNPKCTPFEASVMFLTNHTNRYTPYIHEPIRLELNYSVINTMPTYDATTDHAVFNETCVALDPKNVTHVSSEIKFDIGCVNDARCETDLRINSTLDYNATECSKTPALIRGASSLTITYTIGNYGEPAYFAKFYLILPDHVQFIKMPSICEQDQNSFYFAQERNSGKTVYVCSLTNETPMFRGNETTLSVDIDTRSLTTNIQTIRFEAKASGYKLKNGSPKFDGNGRVDNVRMVDYSNIEISG